jgi:predicted dehydrogenase
MLGDESQVSVDLYDDRGEGRHGPYSPAKTGEECAMAGGADRIGIGMVGAGSIARARHVPGFKAIPGVELVGVVNRTPDSTRQAATEFGFRRTYGTWRELLEDDDVDAVVIATWPYLHAPITLAALDAGKHVLTQARMAMNADEAHDMLAAAREHPELTTMIVPAPTSIWGDRAIERLLAEGAIGHPRTVRLTWGGSVSGGAADPWRRQKRYSGNNIMAVGILYECMARWLGFASAVQARTEIYVAADAGEGGTEHYDVPDYVAIQAEFAGRLHATIEISAHATAGGANSAWIFGSKGTLLVDFDAKTLALSKDGGASEPVEIRADERQDWRVEAEFIGAIRGEEQVRLTDFATGVRYMDFVDAVTESAATGQRIPI